MPQISIIVPVYNIKKYLPKCIDSILNQTFSDFELILVDDGSTDGCSVICDEYKKTDNRIKVIHKENGGLSDARNVGIDSAKGKYIGFIDSDDYIAPDMYETLYNDLVNNNADVSVCGIYNCYENGKCVNQAIAKEIKVYNPKDALKYFLGPKGIGLFAVNKLYANHIFKEIRYPKGKCYEDAFVIVDIVLKASRIVVNTEAKYYYVHHDKSITGSKFSSKCYDVVLAHESNFKKITKVYPDLQDIAEFRVFWAYKQLLVLIANTNSSDSYTYKKDILKITRFIRTNILKILKNKNNSISQLLMYIMIFTNPNLFIWLVRRFL